MSTAESRNPGRRWWIVSGVVVVLLSIAGGALALLWGGRGAREVPVDRAVDEFRRVPSRSDADFMRPAAGVYTYVGRGRERLALFGASQRWGARIPGTVTATTRSCWTFRVEYNDHHSQVLDFCARPTGLVVTGGQVAQRFEFRGFTVEDTNVFSCTPPGVTVDVTATVGSSWEYSCTSRAATRGLTSTFTDRYTFLGRRRLTVDGREVRAHAYRVERSLRGDQSGKERNELWFAAGTGLPVRVHRQADLESPTPLGAVRYSEQGTFELASATPRR